MTTGEIINLVVSSLVFLMLFYQNSIINKMKTFMNMFDLAKVKEYTELRVDTEKLKFDYKYSNIKKNIDELIKIRDIEKISELEQKFNKEKDSDVKNHILKEIKLRLSNLIGILYSGLIFSLQSIDIISMLSDTNSEITMLKKDFGKSYKNSINKQVAETGQLREKIDSIELTSEDNLLNKKTELIKISDGIQRIAGILKESGINMKNRIEKLET